MNDELMRKLVHRVGAIGYLLLAILLVLCIQAELIDPAGWVIGLMVANTIVAIVTMLYAEP